MGQTHGQRDATNRSVAAEAGLAGGNQDTFPDQIFTWADRERGRRGIEPYCAMPQAEETKHGGEFKERKGKGLTVGRKGEKRKVAKTESV